VAEVRMGHSVTGIASLVLCLVSVGLFRLFLPLVVLLSSPFAPEWANQAAGDAGIAWLRMIMLLELVALMLGVAGALQRRRKRLFAFIGITLSGLLLVLQYF
jgi:peptidoglycan/LPS O-acetylase OafA/YrhL